MADQRAGGLRVGLVTDGTPMDTSAFDAVDAPVRALQVTDGRLDVAPADVAVVVTPYELDETDGAAVTRAVRAADESVPVVVFARDGSEAVASEVVRAGATDYVPVAEDAPTAAVPDVVAERAVEAASTRRAKRRESAAWDGAPETETASEPPVADGRVDEGHRVDRERALRRAYEVAAADRPFERKIQDLLGVVRSTLGTSHATLSYVDGSDYTFEYVDAPEQDDVTAGETVPLETTNCQEVVATQETLVIEDVERDAPGLAERTGNAEWSCYLGAPVTVDEEAYGTFCFYDKEVHDAGFSEWQVTFVELFSDWVSYELQRERYVDRLAALNDLHSVVRTVTDGVMHRSDRREIERTAVERLANTGSYALAWVDAPDADAADAAGVEGALRPVAVADSAADAPLRAADVGTLPIGSEGTRLERSPAWPAFREGEVVTANVEHDDSRLELHADRGLERWAAVPIAFEDDPIGVLHVVTTRREGFAGRELAVLGQLGEILGLAIATVEREAVLEHERERLEFVNRFIRHNLLNSLNVVDARTEILSEYVDEAGQSHLETVRSRTADMVELIETLRALIQAFAVDENRDTRPMDLRAVVREEVVAAREAFAHASFSASFPDDSVVVSADELLGEIFENLLANAVQHNDRAEPTVSVVVDADGDAATVRVSDDGPGVPESVLPSVFEKGERGFDSPGTGFGLYLVREIVDAYGGSVSVTNEDEGATFTVRLPLAD